MTDKPIRDERILEAIESCRPGSDDVADAGLAYLAAALAADPELDGLYQRTQQVDAVVAGCFRDVPVPEGLRQRLLDRLEAAETAEPGADDQPEAVACVDEQATRRGRLPSRRWLLAGGLALGAALSIGVFCWLGMTTSDPLNVEMVQSEANLDDHEPFSGVALAQS